MTKDDRGKVIDEARIRSDLGDLAILPIEDIKRTTSGWSDSEYTPVPLHQAAEKVYGAMKNVENHVQYSEPGPEGQTLDLYYAGIGYEKEVVAMRCADDAWVIHDSFEYTD